MSTERRTLMAMGWRLGASPIQVGVMVVRSVLLARWLPIDVFGVFAMGAAIVSITALLAGFGMSSGLLNRVPETTDEGRAAAVLFTLRLALSLVWVVVMLVAAHLLTTGDLLTVLTVLVCTTAVTQMTETPQRILTRRVVHRRVALADTSAIILSSLTAIALAWQGATLWAMLGPEIVTMGVMLFMYFVWRPVWRPRLMWDRTIVRYYLRFGGGNLPSLLLARAIDRLDDLWTGFALGAQALGIYSRAYRFATYPRAILAMPINAVAMGAYAELKHDRVALSQAFFRINGVLIRSALLLMGVLVLVAPELITIVLTDKWLPMLAPFRLMLVFAVLDPLVVTLAGMLVSTGRPERVLISRVVQLAVLVVGLLSLGVRLGVDGVALSVNLMALVGMAILLWQVRPYVDFSLRALWLAPVAALVAGVFVAWVVLSVPGVGDTDWRTMIAKAVAYGSTYCLALVIMERERTRQLLAYARGVLRSRSTATLT